MKRFTLIMPILLLASTASADDMVFRAEANRYAVVGKTTAVTKDCTVTADGKLDARIERVRGKRWLVFIDRDGEEEAQCEIMYTVSEPRQVIAKK